MSLNSSSSLGIGVWSYDMHIAHAGLVKDARGAVVQHELLNACRTGMVGARTVLGRSGRTQVNADATTSGVHVVLRRSMHVVRSEIRAQAVLRKS
jgi:hypothetical protein